MRVGPASHEWSVLPAGMGLEIMGGVIERVLWAVGALHSLPVIGQIAQSSVADMPGSHFNETGHSRSGRNVTSRYGTRPARPHREV